MGFEVIESRQQWNEAVGKVSFNDVYYTYEYCSSSAKLEKGKAKLFYYSTQTGTIIYPVIVREIEWDRSAPVYDTITPYGYGGPLVIGDKSILEDFRNDFYSYCKNQNIITETITFHPLFKNAIYMKSHCNLEYIRKTTAINLTRDLPTIRSQYSKMNKRNLKKAHKNGLVCKEVKKSKENINIFLSLYTETMNCKNAEAYYYFSFEIIEEQLEIHGFQIRIYCLLTSKI